MHIITKRHNFRAHGKVLKFFFNEISNIPTSKHSSPVWGRKAAALVRVCVHKSSCLSYEIPLWDGKCIHLFFERNLLIFYFIFCLVNSRTPGSRQPSPADEAITRPQTLLDPATASYHQQQFQHMLSSNMDLPYHPTMMNHQMQGPVMNGGLQVPQVI